MIQTYQTPLQQIIAEEGAFRVLLAATRALFRRRNVELRILDDLPDYVRIDIGLPPRGRPPSPPILMIPPPRWM